MSFVHDDAEFTALLRIVASKRKLSLGLVEKDYWVTHVLWALHEAGLEVWFKGGTSLSKGFELIQRFSEDLDLKIEPGTVSALAPVADWTRASTTAIDARRSYFETLARVMPIPGATASLDADSADKRWRSASIRINYPGTNLSDLDRIFTPFVVLEIGNARVTPWVPCDISSFVHDELVHQAQMNTFTDNRPKQVRCVHPMVTLLEKLDSLARRVPTADADPASFVRHYEDAARIIASEAVLPPLSDHSGPRQLAEELVREKQIAPVPGFDHPAFTLPPGARTNDIRYAYAAIAPMFWGERRSLDECVQEIREWIRRVAVG